MMFNSANIQNAPPELLCPVGTKEALEAAIAGGADAVYMGGDAFHARMHANLFTFEDLCESIKLAHAYGVKVYITLNTLVLDLELQDWLDAAYRAYQAGADALIVDDLGAVMQLHRQIPELPIHASTQMSIHFSGAGEMLKQWGYSRMVVARETSFDNLKTLCQKSPIEIEAFVHGALCVSHSGQCLFSSLVGGRSGNRGTCAQPCRLPYTYQGKQIYPLSLKDLTLAQHIPELIETGVASLKIEGRMKSPEYVYATARIWRTLLNEKRSATEKELREMGDAFSREGFTDAYFTGAVHKLRGRGMLGVRTDENKAASGQIKPFMGLSEKVPINMHFSMHANQPTRLSLSQSDMISVCVTGDYPELARTAPLSEEAVNKQLSKLGATPYYANRIELSMDSNLMMPLSAINQLRRKAINAMEKQLFPYSADATKVAPTVSHSKLMFPSTGTSATFNRPEQVTPSAIRFFDYQYLPVWNYHGETNGIYLPPIIFDNESELLLKMINDALSKGAKHVLVSNPWHLPLIQKTSLIPHADFRFNITNRETLAHWQAQGINDLIVSPELTLPQCRDLMPYGRVIVYGHLPLMLLEKCVGRELGGCQDCENGHIQLVDRKGVRFPVLKEWGHRSIVCNGDVTWMADQGDLLLKNRISATHYVFTTESDKEVDQIIHAYQKGLSCSRSYRRIGVNLAKKRMKECDLHN